ncbi:MAG: hypothetical protein AB4372_24480, partial [Xenococcus sp. (in: cyanobacteria)]
MSELKSAANNDNSLQGTVVAVQANFYRVLLDKTSKNLLIPEHFESDYLLCTRRSRLKKIGQKVLV